MEFDFDKIMKEVKENHEKLESCSKHDFSIDLTPDRKVVKKYKCSNCGGVVEESAARWYKRGLEHGLNQNLTEDQLQIISTLFEYFILSRKLQPDEYSFGDVQAMKEAVKKHFPTVYKYASSIVDGEKNE